MTVANAAKVVFFGNNVEKKYISLILKSCFSANSLSISPHFKCCIVSFVFHSWRAVRKVKPLRRRDCVAEEAIYILGADQEKGS